jgi:hypothetical protein
MEKTIKVARHRTSQYTVNYPTNNGGVKAYIWAGSKGKKVDTKELPSEVVEYLLLNSLCFKEGELCGYLIFDKRCIQDNNLQYCIYFNNYPLKSA